ncbi:MAG: metallophosphoesterase [Halodesulfurarchaeum sp.]
MQGISVEYDRRAIYLPDEQTLVLADLHVGRDATSEVELPMGEREDLRDRLKSLLEAHAPKQVVFAGDILHSFGSVPYGVPRTVELLIDTVNATGATLSLVVGNHDTMLDSFVEHPVTSHHRVDDAVVIHHGHVLPDGTARDGNLYIIGHEHPAITIEGVRHPCVLSCPDQHEGRSLLVLPAFNRFARGTEVNGLTAADSMSPLLTDASVCRPVVRTEDETLRFPPLGELRSELSERRR